MSTPLLSLCASTFCTTKLLTDCPLFQGTVGFNFHLSIYRGTAENTLWTIPETSSAGRQDVAALSASVGGSDFLPGGVPILCEPGDVYIQSRTGLHCGFPNQSPDFRATLQWGLHRRSTVLDKKMGPQVVQTADYIDKRSRAIQYAIDCRRQRYPEEEPYVYQPFVGREEEARWDPEKKQELYADTSLWNIIAT